MRKRILVTGGNGTVGAGLITELRARGHRVVSCDRSHREDETAFSFRTDADKPTYVRCDVGEFRQIERVFEDLGPFDHVYHAAAEFGRWNGEDFYENVWRTNAIGTKHIIRLQERLKFRLIHFSSSEVYGDWPDLMVEQVMEEHEIKQLNDYAMSKWVNEMQIRNSAEQYKTESVVVRLFSTYGPGEYYSPYRSVNCRFLYCALMGLPWVVHRGHARTSTYVVDAVRTLANIVDNFKKGETYNIAGDAEYTIEELSETILRITGAKAKLVRYRDTEILTTRKKRVDTSKSVRDLGHKNSCDLEEGLRVTAEWMRKTYDLPVPNHRRVAPAPPGPRTPTGPRTVPRPQQPPVGARTVPRPQQKPTGARAARLQQTPPGARTVPRPAANTPAVAGPLLRPPQAPTGTRPLPRLER